MQAITSAVLAVFVFYVAGWSFGIIESNFAMLLFAATVVSGAYWIAEMVYFLPQRKKAAALLESHDQKRRDDLSKIDINQVDDNVTEAKARALKQPWWLDWTAGLFPVIIVVFLLRSFLFEPFKIPSGSMIPTLLVGDMILVNKFTYGLRLPVLNKKITEGNTPLRGDVMVFRYPPKPNMDYIKRVVGVPGDKVAYINKRLTINGQAVETTAMTDYFEVDVMRHFKQFEESLGAKKHLMINDDGKPSSVSDADKFQGSEGCNYTVEGVMCKVPDGQYFMMGDNRDNSLDSRYWGFVPDQNIVGKAVFVWMNFGDVRRIGSFN